MRTTLYHRHVEHGSLFQNDTMTSPGPPSGPSTVGPPSIPTPVNTVGPPSPPSVPPTVAVGKRDANMAERLHSNMEKRAEASYI